MDNRDKTLDPGGSATCAVAFARFSVLVLFVVILNIASNWLVERFEVQIWPEHMEIVDRAVLIGTILYIALMATPFVPGVEIGIVLMTMLGPKGILITYACTLLALSISFSAGRLIPSASLIAFLRWLQLTRAAALAKSFYDTKPEARLNFLIDRLPTQTLPAMVRRRYLVLAVLLNVPGNTLIGGGGGLAMMAGMSRLYTFPMYFLLISVAILPGPIIVILSDYVS